MTIGLTGRRQWARKSPVRCSGCCSLVLLAGWYTLHLLAAHKEVQAVLIDQVGAAEVEAVDGEEDITMTTTMRLHHTILRTPENSHLVMVVLRAGSLVSGLAPLAVQLQDGLLDAWATTTEEIRQVLAGEIREAVAVAGTTARAARGLHLVIASLAHGTRALGLGRHRGDEMTDAITHLLWTRMIPQEYIATHYLEAQCMP